MSTHDPQEYVMISSVMDALTRLSDIIASEVTDPTDKELLQKMVTEIETCAKTNTPAKNGDLAPYRETLQAYPPVLAAMTPLIIQMVNANLLPKISRP